MTDPTPLLRQLPAVDAVLEQPSVRSLFERVERNLVVEQLRGVLQALRERLQAGQSVASEALSLEGVARALVAQVEQWAGPLKTRRVVNATGIILHTGLGRAPLAPAALAAIQQELGRYCVLEVDAETGARHHRESGCQQLLQLLTGAEAATVVNNNAGATLIALAALARGREVVVSRGQLVEIGGSFRIPDVMAESGAGLKEVGCTNRTHLQDYAQAIGPDTAMLLRVHTSNYQVVGFTREVPLRELVALGHKHNLLVMDDLGSGHLVDLSPFRSMDEPTVQASMAAGADLCTFSGDKLLGGPQSGIIVGRTQVIDRIRRHPLFRALRPDKTTLVALEATLRVYLKGTAMQEIPTLAAIAEAPASLAARAQQLLERIQEALPASQPTVVESTAYAGAGALPLAALPSFAVSLCAPSPSELAQRLRVGTPGVFVRIKDDRVLLDVRTLSGTDAADLVAALAAAWEG